jgi:hypothetical protein
MCSIVCTLSEGHYHQGVGGLINSLHKQSFAGDVYVGYRGNLPEWADPSQLRSGVVNWKEAKTLSLSEGIRVHFLPVKTPMHLTNYKPCFMLKLMNEVNQNASQIFYFDPDIVIKCNWSFFEEWLGFGVAMVHEIVNNDMPATHPVRQTWERIIRKEGLEVKRTIASYINAGFIGLKRSDLQFATLFSRMIEIGVNDYQMKTDRFDFNHDRTNPFYGNDQDAMNIAAMCCESEISEYGPEGMDFIHGGNLMSHAVGTPKPWKKNFLLAALMGEQPSLADKEFWKNSNGLIKLHPKRTVRKKQLSLKTAALIGRFYKKN